MNFAVNKPKREVIGNVSKYHKGTTDIEANISKTIQDMIKKVIMYNAFDELGSAILKASITPSQVAVKETI